MADSVTELQLTEYLDIVRRRKWIIASLAALLLIAAIVLSALQTPQFRAEARVRVDLSSSSLLEERDVSTTVRSRNLQNEVEFANSDRVAQRAADDFGSDIGASVAASSNSDTLSFTAVSPDPEEAAVIANTFANAYVSERSSEAGEEFLSVVNVINDRLAELTNERRELEDQLAGSDSQSLQIQVATLDAEEARLRAQLNQIDVTSQLSGAATVSILNAAAPPASAFAPSWVRNIGLALVAGLILGAGVALLLETLDDTILQKRDLELATDGVPVLGVIPSPLKSRFGKKRDRRLVTSRTGPFTESFRTLRSAIELGQAAGSEIRSILVTSANASEGKSTVAAHLAVAFARSGSNVLVVDADMHNPTQHQLFGIANENGLAEQLSNIGNAEIITEQASGEGLVSVIPAGTSASPPAELLRSVPAHEFLEKLSYAYDLVIIDSPPLRPVSDTLPLARIADATLMVSMRGQTNAAELDQAIELLARAQTRPFGAVLNGADEQSYGYGYGYGRSK